MFTISSTKGEHIASIEDDIAYIDWSIIERIAARPVEGKPSRIVNLARILLAIRNQAWKPLLLSDCPRKPG